MFRPAVARDIGEIAVDLAARRSLPIAVCVARPDRTLFACALDGATSIDEARIQRRSKTALAIGQCSLEVGLQLRQSGRTLSDFGFGDQLPSDEGGAIPLRVTGAGVMGAAAISGLGLKTIMNLSWKQSAGIRESAMPAVSTRQLIQPLFAAAPGTTP